MKKIKFFIKLSGFGNHDLFSFFLHKTLLKFVSFQCSWHVIFKGIKDECKGMTIENITKRGRLHILLRKRLGDFSFILHMEFSHLITIHLM